MPHRTRECSWPLSVSRSVLCEKVRLGSLPPECDLGALDLVTAVLTRDSAICPVVIGEVVETKTRTQSEIQSQNAAARDFSRLLILYATGASSAMTESIRQPARIQRFFSTH